MFRFSSIVVCASLVLAPLSAMAADTSNAPAATQQSALAPGSASGVKQAQAWAPTTTMYVAGGALLIIGGALLINNSNGHSNSTTTTGNP